MLNLSFSIHLAISLGLKASLWWNIILGNTMASTCMRLKQVQAIKISTEFYIQQYIKYGSGTASGITAQEMRRV